MCEAAPVVSGALSDMVGGNGLALTGAVGLELAGSRASGNSAILLDSVGSVSQRDRFRRTLDLVNLSVFPGSPDFITVGCGVAWSLPPK
jgi:hypothetical protein